MVSRTAKILSTMLYTINIKLCLVKSVRQKTELVILRQDHRSNSFISIIIRGVNEAYVCNPWSKSEQKSKRSSLR